MTKKAWHEPIEVGLICVRVMYVELTDYVGWHDIFFVLMFLSYEWISCLRTGNCQDVNDRRHGISVIPFSLGPVAEGVGVSIELSRRYPRASSGCSIRNPWAAASVYRQA